MRKQKAHNKRRLILGVTGGYGTGKTTVAGFFRQFGAKVIDADKIAHDLIKPGTNVYKEIIKYFGKGILKKNKCINRNKLAEIVFGRDKDINKLNQIMHPEVKKIIKEQIKQNPPIPPPCKRGDEGGIFPIIVLDVPLLFETSLDKLTDKVVVVKAKREKQFERLLKDTDLHKKWILLRINAQMPLSEKVRRADFIIDNNGTVEQTRNQVEKLRRKLWKN